MSTENNTDNTLKQELDKKLEELKCLEKYFQKVTKTENELKNEINKYREKSFHLEESLQELKKTAEYYETKCKEIFMNISDITWGAVKARIYFESDRQIIKKYDNLLFNDHNKNLQTVCDSEKDMNFLIAKENNLLKEMRELENEISTLNNELSKINLK